MHWDSIKPSEAEQGLGGPVRAEVRLGRVWACIGIQFNYSGYKDRPSGAAWSRNE